MSRDEAKAWLESVAAVAQEESERWGLGVPPLGTPAPGFDATRGVIRDGFKRIAWNARHLIVGLEMWPDVEPRSPEDTKP